MGERPRRPGASPTVDTAASPGRTLPRSFYDRDAPEVAPELLGKVLVRTLADGTVRSGRIVEVEAYRGSDDPASHAFRGRTNRNATMFGPPGHLYAYFTYGMHWCANAVCGPGELASAVLLRALEPLAGIDAMELARPRARRPADLTNGPAKLCEALGLCGADDGLDLVAGGGAGVSGVRIVDDGTAPPVVPLVGPRVGIRVAQERLWRWCDPRSAYVSRPRPVGPGAGATSDVVTISGAVTSRGARPRG